MATTPPRSVAKAQPASLRSSGGGGTVKGDDSAVAHVADGVVGGGKAVVSTLLEPRRHTFSRCSKSATAAAGGGSETAPPRQATRHIDHRLHWRRHDRRRQGRQRTTLRELHATSIHAQGAATAASRHSPRRQDRCASSSCTPPRFDQRGWRRTRRQQQGCQESSLEPPAFSTHLRGDSASAAAATRQNLHA